MAEGKRLVCQHCARTIEVWSDGNPYFVDEAGKKHYAYHPDHEHLDRCIGNDYPHVCLTCGAKRKVDSQKPLEYCPKCGAGRLISTWELEGQVCPYCKVGTFERDPSFQAIS